MSTVTQSVMFEGPSPVHCLSSTITAESPVIGLEPVTITSSRFDETGSFNSTRMP
jgi:hypothetical protein